MFPVYISDEYNFHTFRAMKNYVILSVAILLVLGGLYFKSETTDVGQANGVSDENFSYTLCDGILSQAELTNYKRIRGGAALSEEAQRSIAMSKGVAWPLENLHANVYLDVTGSVFGFYDGSQMPLKIMRSIVDESEVEFWTFKDKVSQLKSQARLMAVIRNGIWSSSGDEIGLNGIIKELKHSHPSSSTTTPLEDVIRDVIEKAEASGELVVVLTDGLNSEESHYTSGDFVELELSRIQLRVLSFPMRFKGTWYPPGGDSKWVDEQKNFYVMVAGSQEQMALFDTKVMSQSPFSSKEVVEVCNLMPTPETKTPCYSLLNKAANAGGDLKLSQMSQSCFGYTYSACTDVSFSTLLQVEVDLSEFTGKNLHATNWEIEGGFPFEVIDIKGIASGGRFCKLATHVITLECPPSFGRDNCTLLLQSPEIGLELPKDLEWMVKGLEKCYLTETSSFVELPLSISHF